MKKTLEDIARQDGRYDPGSFKFVFDGLGYTVKNMDQPGHVTGQVLCDGLRRMALERWGRLTMLVLDVWGLRSTRDFGEIVYELIEHEWMSALPTDAIDDFEVGHLDRGSCWAFACTSDFTSFTKRNLTM